MNNNNHFAKGYTAVKFFNYKKQKEVQILSSFLCLDKAKAYLNYISTLEKSPNETLFIDQMKNSDFVNEVFSFNNNTRWYPIHTIFVSVTYDEESNLDNTETKNEELKINYKRGWVYALFETKLCL